MCIAEKGNKGGKDSFFHLDAFYGSISLSVRTWKYYFSGIMFYDAFFLWKDSENRILRNCPFFLAGAAGLKIYPAVFGLLLVRKNDIKK